MKRLLLIVTISYTIGIIIGMYLKNISISLILGLISIFPVILFTTKCRKIFCIILITTVIGQIYVESKIQKYNKICNEYEDKTIKVMAIICGDVKETDYMYRVNINVERINNKKENAHLILMIKKDKMQIEKLKYGNKITVQGKFSKPAAQRNFKGYDYQVMLQTQEIYGTITVDDFECLKLLKKNQESIVNTVVNKTSNKMKSNIEKLMNEQSASILNGVLLGDSSKISENIKEDFKNCNLSHMLAVSGAHLAYIIIGINFIINKKIFGKKIKVIATIALIAFFMLITNMSPSIMRAGLTTIICLCGTLVYRKPDAITAMAISALYVLIKNPLVLKNIGFQLSYAGTLSLILFANKQGNLISEGNNIIVRIKKYLEDSVKTTICANILIMPLTIYNFNTISLNFVLSNLIIAPIMGITLIMGMVVVLVSFISMTIAILPANILNIILTVFSKLVHKIAQIPFGNITVVTPYITTILAGYAVIFIIYKIKNKRIMVRGIAIISIFLLVINFAIILQDSNKFILHFVDVGQGDCSFIKTPTNKLLLIDSGGSREKEKYDIGKKILVPYLLDRKVKKIDYVIASHFDADHVQGLEEVIKTIKIKNIIVCEQASYSKLYENIIRTCKNKKINIIKVKRGDKIIIDKYVYFDILHPGEKMLDDGKGGLNANAVVMKMYYKIKNSKKTFKILFTGDIEEGAEEEIAKIYGNKLKCDILKVAHHGSKTSSTYEFLQYVKPQIALIGVGENNTFGHPNEGVLERLKKINATIYRTDKDGEITITINENGVYKIRCQIKKD